MKALSMSLAQDLRRMKKDNQHAEKERAKTAKLHESALVLIAEFPHTGPTRQAMWAIARIGMVQCRLIAAANLSSYLFRKKVAEFS